VEWLTTPWPCCPATTPLDAAWTLAMLVAFVLATRYLGRRFGTWREVRANRGRVPEPERIIGTDNLWLALGLWGMATCLFGVGVVAVVSRPGERAGLAGGLLVLAGVLFVALLGWLSGRIGVLARAVAHERERRGGVSAWDDAAESGH
jgi:hypothetical protein